MRKILIQFLLTIAGLLSMHAAFAQLDSIHWLPPMHARSEWGPQYLYLSTPETTPFPVEIKDGQGNLLGSVTISNAQPKRYDIGSSDNTSVLVPEDDLHLPLQGKGLILTATQKFYVGFRAHSFSEYQACDLTCKGTAALGTVFRVGHVIQGANESTSRSNFIGIMATEDSTVINLSDYDASVRFRIAGNDTPLPNGFQAILYAGESIVFSQYVNGNSIQQPPNGMLGALLTSSKPIAVNVGSWTGAPVSQNANDIGIDQITPFDLVGKEYILCKGNGSSILEIPIVIAHLDNTKVWLNGSTTAAATLSAGQSYRVPTSEYTNAGNLYIETSEPVFLYQMIGGVATGDDQMRTAGLIFVPPISCAIPNAVDNLYQPSQIGNINYDGGLMIVAMKDSVVDLRINGLPVSLGVGDAVQGNPDFVTYRRLTLFNSINPPETASIVAKGAVQVALFGRNGAAGYGGFFSGFSKTSKASIALQLVGDGVCPDTLVATGRFDGVQWYYADSLLQFGADTFLVAYAPGLYTAQGYLGVCRRNDFAEDTISAVFNSPQFPYSLTEPACFGQANGTIQFGTPYGGIEPYQYSVNNGLSYSALPNVSGIAAGTYKLVVRDATGCYNRPLTVDIGQPDSFGVSLAISQINPPVKVGDRVELLATPDRPVTQVCWEPFDTLNCPNLLRLAVYPLETTWYTVTVLDEMGCPASDRVQIIVQPNVFAPNVIAPDQSAENGQFTLFSKDQLPVNWLRIYDRWGGLVYENRHFQTNDRSKSWDGTVDGKPCASGVYVFVAEIEYLPGYLINIRGDITILR